MTKNEAIQSAMRAENQILALENDLKMSRACSAELRRNLELCVCRLFDFEQITGSRACELLGGIGMKEFHQLYKSDWSEKW